MHVSFSCCQAANSILYPGIGSIARRTNAHHIIFENTFRGCPVLPTHSPLLSLIDDYHTLRFIRVLQKNGAHLHYDQAGWRAAQPGGRDHRPFRKEGLQARGAEGITNPTA